MNLRIIQNRNKFFIASGILVLTSIVILSVWSLNFGIDFTGGALMEVEITGEQQVTTQDLNYIISENLLFLEDFKVQPTEDGFLVRTRDLSEQEHQNVLFVFRNPANKPDGWVEEINYEVVERRFESIGPVIGEELKNKALWAIAAALLVIIMFIAFAFRKVSKPVQSWKYGVGAIIALAHDILIVTGIFATLGHFLIGFEVDILFVTALLTILGYSVNDTIVVYDRTRENLIYNPGQTFEDTVNKSVNETVARSINTGLTTLLVLLALYLLGGVTIRNFVLALMIGTVIGTYSSIFVASPLLVVWQKLEKK